MATEDTADQAELPAAVTELDSALRELVDASVRTTVTPGPRRDHPRLPSIALAEAPEQALVEARGVFVTPRPERAEEHFGAITDASGRHAPPRRPSDATAVADAH